MKKGRSRNNSNGNWSSMPSWVVTVVMTIIAALSIFFTLLADFRHLQDKVAENTATIHALQQINMTQLNSMTEAMNDLKVEMARYETLLQQLEQRERERLTPSQNSYTLPAARQANDYRRSLWECRVNFNTGGGNA